MVIFHSATAPLFFESWKPHNVGEYAGVCIFLVVLAAATRVLSAIHSSLETTSGNWPQEDWSRFHQRRLPFKSTQAQEDDGDATATAIEQDGWGWEQHAYQPKVHDLSGKMSAARFAIPQQKKGCSLLSLVGRAASDTVLVGLGYLLMLAVMTMNIAYFVAILAGIFVGTFMMKATPGFNTQWDHC